MWTASSSGRAHARGDAARQGLVGRGSDARPPVASLGVGLTYSTPADGLIVGPVARAGRTRRVRVQLLQDARVVAQQVVVAGCDPAIQLVAERLRRHREPRVACSDGRWEARPRWRRSSAARSTSRDCTSWTRGSGESNLPFVRRHLAGPAVTLVTFASWEAGLPGRARQPQSDPRRRRPRTPRTYGSSTARRAPAARLLLDQRLKAEGIERRAGARLSATSSLLHLDVGPPRRGRHRRRRRRCRVHRPAAGLGFIPLQTERYDLVIPSAS